MSYLTVISSYKVFNFINKHKLPSYSQFLHFHRISEIYPPVKDVSVSKTRTSSLSLSSQLMLDYGIISTQHQGFHTLLPFGLRSIDKLVKILDLQMKKEKCQKLNLPHLTSASLWKKSGRYDSCGSELFHLTDRHNHKYFLSPTHEEAITNMISSFSLSHSRLPLRLYQITSKFRDEMRLKHGLIRGREFLMKDLYTFDEDLPSSESTYNKIIQLYVETFNILEIPVNMVEASVGSIGGVKSHEFHIPSDIGEDSLLSCSDCGFTANSELFADVSIESCPICKQNIALTKGIEVGHAFLLGTKYSMPMSAHYKDALGKKNLFHMGCFGIGVTRLLAAGIEALSSNNHLIWPKGLAPFKVCLIPPKKGSKESSSAHWCDYLANLINEIPGYKDEVIVDDRLKLSIGQRLNYAKGFGYPFIIVLGKSILNDIPQFELFTKTDEITLNQLGVLEFLKLNLHN